MLARDIMTPNPAIVTLSSRVREAAVLMRDLGVGFIPVVESRDSMRLYGVLTDRDVAVRCVASHGSGDDPVTSCMTTTPITTVDPDTEIHEVMKAMEREQVRRIPVIDRSGRLVGVVAQGDLALKVGPDEPTAIEALIESISAPSVRIPSQPALHPEIVVGDVPRVVS